MTTLLARNAVANVFQTLFSAILLFVLYRYVNVALGVDKLGIWSVVLATVSASRLADLGLSSGITRFVARDRARSDTARAADVIDTATLTLMLMVGAALPLVYRLITKLLPHLFAGQDLAIASEIVPYALASLWLSIAAAALQGGLDGCGRMDLRAGAAIAGQSLLLVLAVWLVPKYGLIGLAFAQIGQGIFLVIAVRLLLHHVLPDFALFPRRWKWRVLREMLVYGANVQAASAFILMLDPIAKVLMLHFGGVTAAGYFEMANQVVLKARGAIVSANQALVPHVASLAETKPGHVHGLYRETAHLLAFVTLPMVALLVAWAGGFSWLLLGAYHPDFVFLLVLLALGWSANILAGPAYFTNMGTGRVGWNTAFHVTITTLNAGLGWLLGSFFGGNGVASAYALALVASSCLLIAVFQRSHHLLWRMWFAREHAVLALVCVTVIAIACVESSSLSVAKPPRLVAGFLLPMVVIGLAVWFHPLRTRLWNWLTSRELGS